MNTNLRTSTLGWMWGEGGNKNKISWEASMEIRLVDTIYFASIHFTQKDRKRRAHDNWICIT